MNAQIDLVVAGAMHRNELRAEALDDALPRVEDKARALGREGEALREGRAFERALALVADGARRDGQFIDRIGQEAAGEDQMRSIGLDAEAIDRRRDAQRVARLRDVERLGLARKGDGEAALRRLGIAGVGAGIVSRRRAAQQPVEP